MDEPDDTQREGAEGGEASGGTRAKAGDPAAVLAGGGEMGERMRAFDWARTPVGPVERWPASLRALVRLLLDSRQPMFLWWGPALTQFYNDGYRRSLGDDRHPAALGAPGRAFWDEAWPIIGPEVESILAGGPATWHEDHLVPIRRNGRLEDVYWTYGYAPVRDDAGAVAGVLATVVETTPEVRERLSRASALEERNAATERARRAADAERARAEAILEAMADAHAMLDRDFRIVAVNRAAERMLGCRREALLGLTHWEAFPASAGSEVERQYRRVQAGEGEAHFTHHYRDVAYEAYLEVDAYPTAEGGVAIFWRDVTARRQAETALRESEARYRSLFAAIDAGFCVVEVDVDDAGQPVDYRFLEANPAFERQTGLTAAVGRTARELVPELEDRWVQAYGRVARTGEPVRFQMGSEAMGRWFDVYAFRLGGPEERRVAILFNDVSAARATEQERDRLLRALELERARLRQVFEQAPVAVAVLRGRVADALVFELVNPRYEEMIPPGRAPLGRTIRDALPEVAEAMGPVLQQVLDSAEPFLASDYCVPLDRDGDGVPEAYYFNFVYHPLLEADGTCGGIVGVGAEVTESVRARRDAERSRERGERLLSLTAALAATTTPEAAAEVVVAQGLAATGAATGMLALRGAGGPGDPEWAAGAVVLRQIGLVEGLLAEGDPLPLSAPGPAAACLRTGEPFFVESRDALLARFPDARHVWDALDTQALATVPLAVGGETVGAISFTWTAPRAFSVEDRDFFLALGRQAAQALERARLLAAERASRAEAEAARDAAEFARERTERLQALTAALAAARTVEDVATVVVADMVVALGARTGALAGRTPDETALLLLRTVGFPAGVPDGFRRQPLDFASPLTSCFHARTPVWIESREGPAGLDARFPLIAPLWDQLGVESAAFVPLVAAGEAVGVISFAFEGPRTFTPEERAFLLALGQQAALAIERARLFEAERAARGEAEAANRAKSEFLAVMSHELRTPLNAIGGYAELMEMGIRGPVTAQQREDLRRVQTSQRHLLGLINEVLNYARLETGTVHFDVVDVRVRDALLGAEALVAPQAAARALHVLVGPCPPDLAARADAEKLRQVLVNLLSNAVKFTEPGGRVALECDASATHVLVRVRDTGIGIAADQLERIFEPFVQVRADLTRTAEGTGLGLAISRDLARGMGGDLTAESTPGAGSVFTLTLPRA